MSNQAGLGLGDRVHNQELNEYPEEWKEEFARLSGWLREMNLRYGGAVQFRLVDIQSMVGFWKMLRYRIRRYPAVILPGGERFSGWEEMAAAEQRFADHTRAAAVGGVRMPASGQQSG